MNFSDYRIFAEKISKGAGKIVLDLQNKIEITNQKDARDVATTADLGAEKFLINEIAKKFPSHSIFSEEKGLIEKKSEYKWVLDPLDGTKEFVRRFPDFSVNICLTFKGEAIASVVYFPSFNKLFSASKGEGSFVNGEKTNLSKIDLLKNSYIYVYLPTKNKKFVNFKDSWQKIINLSEVAYRVKAASSIALALSFLSDGGMEGYINLSNPPLEHDLLPGLLIAQESGAIVKNEGDSLVVANNQEIYNQIMEVIGAK